jgi:hypothetical protein
MHCHRPLGRFVLHNTLLIHCEMRTVFLRKLKKETSICLMKELKVAIAPLNFVSIHVPRPKESLLMKWF